MSWHLAIFTKLQGQKYHGIVGKQGKIRRKGKNIRDGIYGRLVVENLKK
jgi:hypothetical protein